MKRELNALTQPFHEQPVFNNWDVVPMGWYLVCQSKEVRRGQVRSFELCGQRIVLFRGEDDKVRALDAFCAHMGADLGIGKVVDNSVRCFFHHWRYDGGGECIEIPCGEPKPKRAKLKAYGTDEKYGHIWVYPDKNPPEGVAEYKGLEGKKLHWVRGRPIERNCHPHINAINGIDAQHLRTVHGIPIDMTLESQESEDARVVDFTLTCPLPSSTIKERILCWVLGGNYAYSMRYAEGSIGLLSVMERVRWFGRGKEATPVRMVFAQVPLAFGRARTVPIYVAEKKPGLRNWLKAKSLLWIMKIGYLVLKDEDGKVYDNIRFHPKALLKMDRPVAMFIRWVNRLPLSDWSSSGKKRSDPELEREELVSLPDAALKD